MKKFLSVTVLFSFISLMGIFNSYASQIDNQEEKEKGKLQLQMQSDVSGDWYNQLGSKMVLKQKADKIDGTYQSAAGAARGIYKLDGIIDSNGERYSQPIGFTVLWKNQETKDLNSVTTWSGLYDTSKDEIRTFWLLTLAQEKSKDEWQSVLIGRDVFTRTQPTKEDIQNRRIKGNFPYPMSK
jgi:hypothetical protein